MGFNLCSIFVFINTQRFHKLFIFYLPVNIRECYRVCRIISSSTIEFSFYDYSIKTLMNIYGTLGDNEGFMKMKGMIE